MRYILFFMFTLLSYLQAYDITYIKLSDKLDGNSSKVFSVNTSVIYTLIHLKNVKAKDSIIVEWIRKNKPHKSNTIIAKQKVYLHSGIKSIHFHYKNTKPYFIAGEYILKVISTDKRNWKRAFRLYTPIKDKISKIYLSSDIKKNSDGTITPKNLKEHFLNSEHKIYAIIPFKDIKEGKDFMLKWIVINDGVNQNRVISRKSAKVHYFDKNSSGVISANIYNVYNWPDGIFEVDLFLDKRLITKKRFTIGDTSKIIENIKMRKGMLKVDKSLEENLITNLSNWILETINNKDMKALYEHSVYSYRDSINWSKIEESFEYIFNSKLDWKEIFKQKAKIISQKVLNNGALYLEAIYRGIKSVDIIIAGTFYKEDDNWRLLGFVMRPLKTK